MNTMMNKRDDSNVVRVHVVPIAMSPIQGDTAGTERATGCIRQLMSGMPTESFICTVTS
jgi:hypothetical protein